MATIWTAVIFDLDDTLFLEREFVLSGFDAVAAELAATVGVPASILRAEFQKIFESGERSDVFGVWLRNHGHSVVWLPQLIELYRSHSPRITLVPEMLELLADLRQRIPLGLITDGHLATQRGKIKALAIEPYFSAITCSDLLGREFWKPHPRPYRETLGALDVPAESAVYVADNPAKDFLGARGVGMATVRVRWPGGMHAERFVPSPEFAADHEVTSVGDLRRLLLENIPA